MLTVIPEAFFKRLWEAGTGPRAITDRPGVFPQRAPLGAYDGTILCSGCETIFGPLDAYANAVLREDVADWQALCDGGRAIAYDGGRYDCARLKLFALSLAWRASVSTHSVYELIKLGPHAQSVLQMLKAEDPGDGEAYGTIVARFGNAPARAILHPHLTKLDGCNYALFTLGTYLCGFRKFCPSPFRKF